MRDKNTAPSIETTNSPRQPRAQSEEDRRTRGVDERICYSTGEFAAMTGLHPESVRRMIRQDRIPVVSFGGRSNRIPRWFVQQCVTEST